ncbi:MAG: GNAT family N-acetyltransferase [Legionellaceae bacterium]|nr:GNAT family N-acetyltransferase [Legionellaceae bacterium]MBP9775427.1 GNAT family N-acetyltransferase [Legionellaceae bacterium]
MTPTITLRTIEKTDIPIIVQAFELAQWSKPTETFEHYLREQTDNKRAIWLAFQNNQFAGYVTLKWESQYEPFLKNSIPEIMDLNVLPKFQKQGIGSLLLARAEQEAFKEHDTVGLGTGLYADYGQAIQMYIDRGYKPDGRGVTYHYQTVTPGNKVCLDDDLILWFSKKHTRLKTISPQSIQTAPHFIWGNACEGWWLHQDEKFTVISELMPPNTAELRHYHKHTDQFFYCLQGELWIQFHHEECVLQDHEGIHIPAGAPHQVKNNSSNNVRFLVFSSSTSHNDRVDLEA